MTKIRNQNALIVVTAYGGDAKSLLAFDLVTEAARKGLAGFSIQTHPPNTDPYYIDNNLRLPASPDHAQVAGESPFSRHSTWLGRLGRSQRAYRRGEVV
jgi:hypothetical protein